MDKEPKPSPEEEAREEAKDITFRVVMMSLPVISGGGLLAAIAHVEAEKMIPILEAEDKEDGDYQPDFYAVIEID